jgi:hypothetical protein
MDYVYGSSSQFVHLHDDKWCVYQKFEDGRYLTPEKKSPMSKEPRDSYFSHEPLLNIAYRYSNKNLALARAKRLYEDGMFVVK